MRSLIIIEVEHGETTDPLEVALGNIQLELAKHSISGLAVLNYSVKVDLPECFRLV